MFKQKGKYGVVDHQVVVSESPLEAVPDSPLYKSRVLVDLFYSKDALLQASEEAKKEVLKQQSVAPCQETIEKNQSLANEILLLIPENEPEGESENPLVG